MDYDDGTAPVTGISSDDPLALSHTFATTGIHTVQIEVWNCGMSVPAIDMVQVEILEQEFVIYLLIVQRNWP